MGLAKDMLLEHLVKIRENCSSKVSQNLAYYIDAFLPFSKIDLVMLHAPSDHDLRFRNRVTAPLVFLAKYGIYTYAVASLAGELAGKYL